MTRHTRRRACIAAGVAALALAAPARAQVATPDTVPARPPAAAPDTTPVTPADTTAARPLVLRGDTVPAAPGDTARRTLRPRDAFLRSLVLPGWGQSSIGAPGRGAVYFGLEVGSLWMVYKSDQRLSEARERERNLRASGQLAEGQSTGLVRQRRAQREDWITLSVFWLFFSGADAFVAAHLREFDARVGAAPTPDGQLQIQATVPLGPR